MVNPNYSYPRIAEILLVEDNPGDVLFAQKAFEKSKLVNPLTVAADGEAALAQLQNWIPGLILLDMNLPGISGQKVLQAIKADPRLRHIPGVILVGSSAEADVIRKNNLPASAYLVKPINLEKLSAAIGRLENFNLTLTIMEAK